MYHNWQRDVLADYSLSSRLCRVDDDPLVCWCCWWWFGGGSSGGGGTFAVISISNRQRADSNRDFANSAVPLAFHSTHSIPQRVYGIWVVWCQDLYVVSWNSKKKFIFCWLWCENEDWSNLNYCIICKVGLRWHETDQHACKIFFRGFLPWYTAFNDLRSILKVLCWS